MEVIDKIAVQDKAASLDNIKDTSFKDEICLLIKINNQDYTDWIQTQLRMTSVFHYERELKEYKQTWIDEVRYRRAEAI